MPIIGTNLKASTFQRGLVFFFLGFEVLINTGLFVFESLTNSSNSLKQMGIL
jgi:hypothetical protein